MSIRVSIVEDDTRLRESLTVLVSGAEGLRFVSSFSSAEAALKGIPVDKPNVVLMDINLPRMSGIECASKLKDSRPALQIIMLTVYMDDEKIFESLKAGASGYLLKKTSLVRIVEAIVDVHGGGSPMSNSIARKVVQYFQQQKRADDSTNGITEREFEILTHLAEGYQYKEIADKLSISVKTVCNHLQNIYQKMHVHSRTEAVVKFLGRQNAR